MKASIMLITAIVLTQTLYAKTEKINWKICDKEIKEFCTTANDDHEKHECLEEAPQAKVTKACRDFNSSLEGKFTDKHDHDK